MLKGESHAATQKEQVESIEREGDILTWPSRAQRVTRVRTGENRRNLRRETQSLRAHRRLLSESRDGQLFLFFRKPTLWGKPVHQKGLPINPCRANYLRHLLAEGHAVGNSRSLIEGKIRVEA